MKKYYFILCTLILSGLMFSHIFAQGKSPEKKVTISYTWSKISTHGSNQLAVWVEDQKGNYICTLFATRYTAKGGYLKRPLSLSEWTSKVNLKNATKEEVDAITGATPASGKQLLNWNCKDKSGIPVPKGTYIIRMEANILDADKMFYTGEIKIGGKAGKATGEITYSKPSLAKGNVLFRDVTVEYK